MKPAARVLLVDDDSSILETFSRMLRSQGYEVLEAPTGCQGLEMARGQNPDLVLLDVMLPDISGLEVCRQIKSEPALQSVFVVFFSGQATDTASKIAGLESGADDYISKTVEPPELLARVRTALRLREITAALRESEQRHRQAAEFLRASEARFRQLVENIKEVFWITDVAKTEMVFISPGYEEIWGRTCESLYASPRDWIEAIHPEDRQRVSAAAWSKQLNGQYDEVYRIVRPDGSVRWIQDRAFPIRDESGEIYRVVGLAEDITKRKAVQAQLAMLAHAVESTSEPICITDLDDRFTFVNRAFQNTYGYTEAEMLGATPRILLSPKNRPGLMAEILEQTRRGGWTGELIDRAKDGREFPIFLSTSRITDQNGAVVGLIGVARDISDRKRAERQNAAFSLLGHELSASNTPEQAAEVILRISADLFGWDAGYLDLYSEDEDKILSVVMMDMIDGERRPVSSNDPVDGPTPLMRWVMKEGAQLINGQTPSAIPVGLIPFGDVQRPSLSRMFVPIRSGGVFVGLLSIQSYTPNAYTPADLKLLETFAAYCGGALRRIKVTEALRQAEAKYRSIFENATEGIYQSTPDGRLIGANPALARMFGYSTPDEMISAISDIGKQMYVLPEQRTKLKQLLETQGSVQDFQAPSYKQDGSQIQVSVNGRVVRNARGQIAFYEGTIQDITARKWQERLSQDQRDFAIFLSSTNDLKAAMDRLLAMVLQDEGSDCAAACHVTSGGERLELLACRGVSDAFAEHCTVVPVSGPATVAAHSSHLAPSPRSALASFVERFKAENLRACEIIPIQHGGVVLAVLALGSHSQDRIPEKYLHAAEAFAAQAGGAIARIRAVTELKRSEEELRQLPRRIIEAQEAERLRVARELHDGVNQILASAKLRLLNLAEHMPGLRPAGREILARCGKMLVQALEENRRIAQDLRPSDLDELGLAAACQNLCRALQARVRLKVSCRTSGLKRRLPAPVELNLFRIVQEGLNNVEKHSRAKTVQVRIALRREVAVLTIKDDGRGFALPGPKTRRRKTRGVGLTNIRERAAALGGSYEVESAPAQGTTLVVRVPCPEEQ